MAIRSKQDVLESFGKTNDLKEAGFIFPDGKMLKLSERGGERDMPHDIVVDAPFMEDEDYKDPVELHKFISHHKAVRFHFSDNPHSDYGCGTYSEFATKLTDKQKAVIKESVLRTIKVAKDYPEHKCCVTLVKSPSYGYPEYEVITPKMYYSCKPKIYEVEDYIK